MNFHNWSLRLYVSIAAVNACAGMLGGIGCDGNGQSCDYTASYVVEPDDTVTFTVSATTTGWVAIGVSGDRFMVSWTANVATAIFSKWCSTYLCSRGACNGILTTVPLLHTVFP